MCTCVQYVRLAAYTRAATQPSAGRTHPSVHRVRSFSLEINTTYSNTTGYNPSQQKQTQEAAHNTCQLNCLPVSTGLVTSSRCRCGLTGCAAVSRKYWSWHQGHNLNNGVDIITAVRTSNLITTLIHEPAKWQHTLIEIYFDDVLLGFGAVLTPRQMHLSTSHKPSPFPLPPPQKTRMPKRSAFMLIP